MMGGVDRIVFILCAVFVAPSYQQFAIPLQNQSVQIGGTGLFYAVLSGGVNNGEWFKNDVTRILGIPNKFIIDNSNNVRQLAIYNVEAADAGKYTLRINGLESSAYLTVSGVSIVSSLQDQTVSAGTDVVLTITLSGAVPSSQVKWEYFTTEIFQNSQFVKSSSGNSHSLTIRNVAQSNAGQYTFTTGSLTSTMFLQVTATADVNECTLGTDNCHPQATCTNTIGSFTCACNSGYSGNGVSCTDINECTLGTNNCHPQATCTNTIGSFICSCNSGYSGNGVICSDINECQSGASNCNVNAQCTNTIGSYTCTCNVGFVGNGITCTPTTDVDECTLGTNNCHSQATCTNTIGSFTCTCNSGYSGNGVSCIDVDECTLGNNNCHPQATCTNTIGSFICTCNSGYSGNGVSCSDVNECASSSTNNCSPNAFCTNIAGSFGCTCNSGFTGNGVVCTQPTGVTIVRQVENATTGAGQTVTFTTVLSQPGVEGVWYKDGVPVANSTNLITYRSGQYKYLTIFRVQASDAGAYMYQVAGQSTMSYLTVSGADVNECLLGTNNCHPQASCANTIGSFTCSCNSGYIGNGVSCSDFNECQSSVTNNCNVNAQCTNNVGSYTCTCNAGFVGNGITCTPTADVNECLLGTNNCHPQATCTNTIGSFTCTCNSGYSGNGVSCTDINECASSSTNNCSPNAFCTNIAGSYRCTCNPGFTGNGFVCTRQTDVDECTLGTNNCHPQATCTNTIGSFTCTCNSGYSGNGVFCSDINECTLGTNNCHPQATCTNTIGSFTCRCNSGYSGNGVFCSDVNECTLGTNNCHPQATCTNTIGSFTCACNSGFTGNGVFCSAATQDLCRTAQNSDGIGYRNHPTDCNKYLQCYFSTSGMVKGIYRSCPFGFYWDQSTRRCSESWKVTCPTERCSGKCKPHFSMAGSCRAYWECNKGVAEGKCCMPGFMYEEGRGCRPNFFCRDTCPTACADKDACAKRPTFDSDASTYNISVGLLGWMPTRCVSGSYFEVADCGCNLFQPTCQTSYDLTFNDLGYLSSARSSWLRDTNVNVTNGYAIFAPDSSFTANIQRSSTSPFNPVMFIFRYREANTVSGRRVLLSTSNCKNDNTLVIAVNEGNITFELTSYYGNVVTLPISTSGFSRSDWVTVGFLYNGYEMMASITQNTAKYYDRVYASDSNVLECGMKFGTDGRTNTPPFVGELDRLQVYNCNPGNVL